MEYLNNGCQNDFQIFHESQKPDHIFHNIPSSHCFLVIFPQTFRVISAYKDPVENQHMRKIWDKFVTGFFVIILGTLWYCTKCIVNPIQYKIIIYDVLGNQVNIDGVRTDFKTPKVANNFISEYQEIFSQYSFSMASEMPVIKKNWLFQKLKKY